MVGYRRRQQNFWKLSSLCGNLNLRILFSFCRLTQLNRPSSLKYPCFMAFYNTGDKTKHGNSFLNAFSWIILCKFRHKYSLNLVLKLQQITIDSIKYIYIYMIQAYIYIYISSTENTFCTVSFLYPLIIFVRYSPQARYISHVSASLGVFCEPKSGILVSHTVCHGGLYRLRYIECLLFKVQLF